MPIYEYQCQECRRVSGFLIMNLKEPFAPVCPKCGNKKMAKQMSTFAMPRGVAEAQGGADDADGMPELDNPKVMRAMAELEQQFIATARATEAERALLRYVEGGCQIPLGAHARIEEGELAIDGVIGSLDGKKIVITEAGWPSEGRVKKGAVPSPAMAAYFYRHFLSLALRLIHAQGYNLFRLPVGADVPQQRLSRSRFGENSPRNERPGGVQLGARCRW